MKMEIRGDLTALTSGEGRQRLLDTIQRMLSPIAEGATSGSHLIQTNSFSITMTYSEKESDTCCGGAGTVQTSEEELIERARKSPSTTEESLKE